MKLPIEHLYHLAEADNLASIHQHGLMSTEELIQLAGLSEPVRTLFLRSHRPDNIRLSNGVVIRDQRPQPPGTLARVLDDGLQPADWYALLNRFVFFWSDPARMKRHRGAFGERPQVVLTFDRTALLKRFEADAFVSPINSGNTRRRAVRRGRNTLLPYNTWADRGWPTGQRWRPPAEFLFACSIPLQAPYLVRISPL
jgi:hypothetical protein